MRRIIGKTGLNVFSIGLGAMPLSIHGRPPLNDAIDVIHRAIDAGLDFIDTANAYCIDEKDFGYNERTIAEALKTVASDAIVVATKGGLIRPGGAWLTSGSPESLRRACEQSLRDLHVECISLYQFHAPDPEVPFAESVGELVNLQSEGKIQHIGLSNVDQRQLAQALEIAEIQSVQNRCHVLCQTDFKNGLVEYCRSQSITYIPYSPVGGGNGHVRIRDNSMMQEIASKHDASPYQVALAWLLAKSDNIIPIPGASRTASILSSMQAVRLKLSERDVSRIDALK